MSFTLRNIAQGVYLEHANGNVQFFLNGAVAELSDGRIMVNRQEIANEVGDFTAIADDVAGAPISVAATLALILADIALLAKSDTAYPVTALKAVEVTYDFAVDAGAVSEIDLQKSIPSGAKITHVFLNEDTTLTSAADGATIELKLGTTAAGNGSITSVLTANNSNSGYTEESTNQLKITTAIRSLTVEIKVEAITAGAVTFTVIYV